MTDTFSIETETEIPAETPLETAPLMSHAQIAALIHSAATAASRIAEIEATATAERARILATVQPDLDIIDEYLSSQTEGDRRLIADAKAQAEAWMRARLDEIDASGDHSAKRSAMFPRGEITTRRTKASPVRVEAAAAELLEWAITHDLYRPSEPVVDWAAIKAAGTVADAGDAFHVGGEPVPGVVLSEPSTTVTVELWPL